MTKALDAGQVENCKADLVLNDFEVRAVFWVERAGLNGLELVVEIAVETPLLHDSALAEIVEFGVQRSTAMFMVSGRRRVHRRKR